MDKFSSLTNYLTALETDQFGAWVVDNKCNGLSDDSIQIPYVNYSDIVNDFVSDVYKLNDENPEFCLNNYSDILEKNDIKWAQDPLENADVSNLNAQCIMALIISVVRAERFCDGTLLSFLKSGTIKKWLIRLQEIDSFKD